MASREHEQKAKPSDYRPNEAAQEGLPPRQPKQPSSPSPIFQDAGTISPLGVLLGIERQARQCANLIELRHLIANESRKLNRARQIVVADIDFTRKVEISAISAVSSVDSSSMLVVGMRQLVERVLLEHPQPKPIEFTLPAYCDADSDLANAYPFRELAWVPLLDRRGTIFAGMLLARETVWTSDDLAIAHRIVRAGEFDVEQFHLAFEAEFLEDRLSAGARNRKGVRLHRNLRRGAAWRRERQGRQETTRIRNRPHRLLQSRTECSTRIVQFQDRVDTLFTITRNRRAQTVAPARMPLRQV